MTPEELTVHLESSGVVLAAEAGRLRVNAPRGSLTEELKAAIAGSRDDLLALLERRAVLQAAPIERIGRSSALPVSSFQERMWILQRMDPGNTDYNIVSVWKSTTRFSADRQKAAVRALVGRHEILHSFFDEVGDRLAMQLLPPERVAIELRDLRAYPETRRHELLLDTIDQEAHTPFDLTSGAAIRFIVYCLGDSEAVTLCVAHHIAVDAWSLSLLEKEFAVLCAQGAVPMPALSLQYADYAAWQRSRQTPSAITSDLQWWRRYLSGAPQLSVFPPDRFGSTKPTGATREFNWDATLVSGLQSLARSEGATVYTALLAACAVVLRWHTGQQDFVLGSPMGVRERVELETMIGPFVGLLLIRLDVSGDPSFAELLRRTRDSMLEAYGHRQVPFEALLEHLKPPRMLDHSPMFQIAVVQHNAPGAEARMSFGGGTMHELTWFVREVAGSVQCSIEFRSDLYSDAAIGRIAEHLEAVLRRAVEKAGSRVSELTQLTGSEWRQVVEVFNGTELDVPEESFVAHFEQRAAATPDATAIVHQDAALSYSELNRRANALAHHLRDIGVDRGTRIALCLERSLQLVVALLAIQKTGEHTSPSTPVFRPTA